MAKSRMKIEWHEDCLKHQRISLEYKENQLRRLQAEVNEMRSDIAFYAEQINTAVDAGKDAFDRDSFLASRRDAIVHITLFARSV